MTRSISGSQAQHLPRHSLPVLKGAVFRRPYQDADWWENDANHASSPRAVPQGPLQRASRLLQRMSSAGRGQGYTVLELGGADPGQHSLLAIPASLPESEEGHTLLGEAPSSAEGGGWHETTSCGVDGEDEHPRGKGLPNTHNEATKSSDDDDGGVGNTAAAKTSRRRRTAAVAASAGLLALAAAGALLWRFRSPADRDAGFKAWKKQYKIQYSTRDENERRFEIFNATRAGVAAANEQAQGAATFTLYAFAAFDETELASMRGHSAPAEQPLTPEDVRSRRTAWSFAPNGRPLRPPPPPPRQPEPAAPSSSSSSDGDDRGAEDEQTGERRRRLLLGDSSAGSSFPAGLDWAALGRVGPVKDQGCARDRPGPSSPHALRCLARGC